MPKWPPPGLERMQGDLVSQALRSALAGGLLVLPILFVAARDQEFATLGPLADAWWVTIVLTSVGLGFALDAIVRLARTARRSRRALQRGYDVATVAYVLVDGSRDMGFLLHGGRHFSVIEEPEREGIAAIRVASVALSVFAGLWLLVALSAGLFLAARGVLTPLALQVMTLLPAVIAYMLAGVTALVQQGRVRRARSVWYRQPWANDLATEEIVAWKRVASPAPRDSASGAPRVASILRWATLVLAVVGLFVVIPVLTLVPSSAVGPVLTALSAPSFESYRGRAARVEAFRSYSIEGDVSISGAEAGRLLNDLIHVGSTAEPAPGARPPSRRIAAPWLGEGENPFGLDPFAWGDSLLVRVGSGVDGPQRDYLMRVTAHPASEDFTRLAHATALDVVSARWVTPFPPGMTMATIPLPSYAGLRDAANVHLAAAALAVVEGRPEDAQRRIAEVIAVGFLLTDHGPTLIDNFVGLSLIESGGAALAGLFRVTGQATQAAELSRLNGVAERAAGLVRSEQPQGTEAWVRALPGLVVDPALVRGLRWEYFINLATITPCLNMHRMLFGPDEDYAAFVEEARASLVRWPAEEAIFELARHGWIGAAEPAGPTFIGRVTNLFMNTDEDSCGSFVQHMQAAGELF